MSKNDIVHTHPVQSRNLPFRLFRFRGVIPLFLLFLSRLPVVAINDFQTDNPKLIIELDGARMREISGESRETVFQGQTWIRNYHQDWQWKFERIRRNIHMTLVPTERQINVSGIPAEGLWTWNQFNNEEGSLTLGIIGHMYVNLNSTYISQQALVAHEASHAFLLAYCPKLLETGADYRCFNEGLAELFALDYEKDPWRHWHEAVAAQKHNEPYDDTQLSSFAQRLIHVLNGKPQCSHDLGFFFLLVVRHGKVDLEKDLKECTNTFIRTEIEKWLEENGSSYDLPIVK